MGTGRPAVLRIFVTALVVLSPSMLEAVEITVWGDALNGSVYELWGGQEPCPLVQRAYAAEPVSGYYSAPDYGYVQIGAAAGSHTFEFDTPYRYYMVATRSEMALDAVRLGRDIYLEGVSDSPLVTWGNLHVPFSFDAEGRLIGSPLDYMHDACVWGEPDGYTDRMGIPPNFGGLLPETFQGLLVFESKPNLAVVTHGRMASAEGWVGTMAEGIEWQLEQHGVQDQWDVVAFDWRTGARYTLGGTVSQAKRVGKDLGERILAAGYQRVHLIGHSAGSWVIDAAADRMSGSGVDVHLTFLDAFVPWGRSALAATLGDTATWAEQYVDAHFLRRIQF